MFGYSAPFFPRLPAFDRGMGFLLAGGSIGRRWACGRQGVIESKLLNWHPKDPLAKGTVKIAIQYGNEVYSIEGSEGETLLPTEEKVVAKFKRLTSQILGAKMD